MAIFFSCPNPDCPQNTQSRSIDDKFAGRKVKCPDCMTTFTIPDPAPPIIFQPIDNPVPPPQPDQPMESPKPSSFGESTWNNFSATNSGADFDIDDTNPEETPPPASVSSPVHDKGAVPTMAQFDSGESYLASPPPAPVLVSPPASDDDALRRTIMGKDFRLGDLPDVGFRMFLSPILVVFIWWFTVFSCVIGFVGFTSYALRPYFAAMSEYNRDMRDYRSGMQEYNRAKQKYSSDMQEYERAMQKYRSDMQEYNSALQEYNRMTIQQRVEREKPVEPRRPVEPTEPSEPGRPASPTEGIPVVHILIAMGIVVYVLISTRIILEFIAVNFRMEKHQRTMKTTFKRFEKMSKTE